VGDPIYHGYIVVCKSRYMMMIMAAPYACMHVHISMVYTLHGVYIAFKFAIKSCAIGKLADQGFF